MDDKQIIKDLETRILNASNNVILILPSDKLKGSKEGRHNSNHNKRKLFAIVHSFYSLVRDLNPHRVHSVKENIIR